LPFVKRTVAGRSYRFVRGSDLMSFLGLDLPNWKPRSQSQRTRDRKRARERLRALGVKIQEGTDAGQTQ